MASQVEVVAAICDMRHFATDEVTVCCPSCATSVFIMCHIGGHHVPHLRPTIAGNPAFPTLDAVNQALTLRFPTLKV